MKKISIGIGSLVILLVISFVVSLVFMSGVSQASSGGNGTPAYLPVIFKPENTPTPTVTNTPQPPTATSTPPPPTATNTSQPTATHTPRPPTATHTPHSPTPTATQSPPPGNCTICSYNAYNCPNFDTQAQAQACFNYCWAIVGYDVHQLDADEDGVACEALPIMWVIPEQPEE